MKYLCVFVICKFKSVTGVFVFEQINKDSFVVYSSVNRYFFILHLSTHCLSDIAYCIYDAMKQETL